MYLIKLNDSFKTYSKILIPDAILSDSEFEHYISSTVLNFTFTTGRNFLKTADHIDPKTVYVHLYTLENIRQNDCNRW